MIRTSVAVAAVLAAVNAGVADAATIQVDTTSDSPAVGTCTLREAIASADGNSDFGNCTHTGTYGDDTITFNASTFGGTITLGGTELNINPTTAGTLTIQGPGAVLLAVDANNASRVFHVSSPATNLKAVTISGLKITHGALAMTGSGTVNRAGGGILNDGDLTLVRDYVWNNSVQATATGGSSSVANAVGGGVENTGSLTVSFTQVASNALTATASNGSSTTFAGAGGAGIDSLVATGLSIDHSAIYSNAATAAAPIGAGALSNPAGGGITTATANTSIVDSTIDENSVTATGLGQLPGGGGISTGADTALIDDTITGNTAAAAGANLSESEPPTITTTIKNTILADPSGGADNCFGTITSQGHNIADGATDSCSLTTTADQPMTAPVLLPFDLYGGPTPTRPPDVGSPALDKGLSSETDDQRLLHRPWQFDVPDASAGNGADIGAVEIQGPFVSATDPASPSANRQPKVIGGAEDGSTIELHTTSDCTDSPLGTGTVATFALPGIAPTSPLALGSTTTFRAQSLYGTARSACSPTSASYKVPPSTAPPSTTPPATATPKKKCKKAKGKKRAASAKKKKCKKAKKK